MSHFLNYELILNRYILKLKVVGNAVVHGEKKDVEPNKVENEGSNRKNEEKIVEEKKIFKVNKKINSYYLNLYSIYNKLRSLKHLSNRQ